MYAFRKPFTAATYDGQVWMGLGLKSTFVLAQLFGYMFSKFIGIKVVSEMRSELRAFSIVGLVVLSELALVGFAYLPLTFKIVMIFLNGLPLGMIFGLVLSYLEGRKQTEALSAVLCASFIVSSGVVKSVGRWLVQDMGVAEFSMPMVAGMLFFLPLVISVWILQSTPPPDQEDVRLRKKRAAMTRLDRRNFLHAYWPGLLLLVFVYVALTIVRTVRDDFGVEIWRDMGISQTPSIFALSETIVAVIVTLLSGLTICVKNNFLALRFTVGMMCAAFVLVLIATLLKIADACSPFVFMVTAGVGLYVPYVAFHTTIFERLVASARMPSNLGFLMYMADSIGYLGYAMVISVRTGLQETGTLLPFFQWSVILASSTSILSLLAALIYFGHALTGKSVLTIPETSGPTCDPVQS
jgi:hypothetical protein